MLTVAAILSDAQVMAALAGLEAVRSALAHDQPAFALAEELGMRPLQVHCHCGLGMLYATTGQREPARTALATRQADTWHVTPTQTRQAA